jgi:acetyl-CoA carboxylase carboxyltransferase component
MIYAYSEATVPKMTVILRKAYGGAYIVMSSKHLRSDYNLAWPQAEIAVMGPEAAVKIVYRKELSTSSNSEVTMNEYVQKYREDISNPYLAASRGYVDDIISPVETRERLIAALESLRQKRQETPARKHGNIPL